MCPTTLAASPQEDTIATPITLIVNVTKKEGTDAALEELLGGLLPAVAKEEGTLDYRAFGAGDNQIYMETYADSEAIVAHMTNPIVANALEVLSTVFDLNSMTVLGDVNEAAREMLDPMGATYLAPIGGVSRLFPEGIIA